MKRVLVGVGGALLAIVVAGCASSAEDIRAQGPRWSAVSTQTAEQIHECLVREGDFTGTGLIVAPYEGGLSFSHEVRFGFTHVVNRGEGSQVTIYGHTGYLDNLVRQCAASG